MTLCIALVGGPMYDHLYSIFDEYDVEVVVHADHPTLNRKVAEMLAAGERIFCRHIQNMHLRRQVGYGHLIHSLTSQR